ncbi:MAG: hypothetical protein CMM04_07720 [Rhodopirellula sp.]|nr:hypothetical protein [Rhodopirellula sp.]
MASESHLRSEEQSPINHLLLAQFQALNHLTALLIYAFDTEAEDLIYETPFTIENLLAGS